MLQGKLGKGTDPLRHPHMALHYSLRAIEGTQEVAMAGLGFRV